MAEYIEREALWRAFEYEPFYDNADRDEIVLPKIDDFPAADVAPVRHGRWICDPNPEKVRLVCSVCGQGMPFVPEYLPGSPPYCNCGAKMNLEGGESDGS